MAAYLHGVETVESRAGAQPVTVVRTSVIALVGIAPAGPSQQLTLVSNPTGADQFGLPVPGFTIPQALSAIYAQGAGAPVLVVNVFNPATHTQAVTGETVAIANLRAKLANTPIGAVTLTNAAASVTYVNGADYTIDAYGNIQVLQTITEGQSLRASYSRLNAAAVAAADIIGSLNAGVRTGTRLYELAYNLFGFRPKIIIAPGFTGLTGVAAQIATLAGQNRAMYLLDSPVGKLPTAAITDRGPAGTVPGYNSSSERLVPLYPQLKALSLDTSQEVVVPYSAYFAGVIAATDLEFGYWYSPSNKEIKGITGVERNLTAFINDPNSETNLLNAAGIATVYNSFGTGFRSWGVKNASFPVNSGLDTQITTRRIKDVIIDSTEFFVFQFLGQPITRALIDQIVESVNRFLRQLVQRGALADGLCYFNEAKNPPEKIAAGELEFDYEIAPSPTLERVRFNSILNTQLLQALLNPQQ